MQAGLGYCHSHLVSWTGSKRPEEGTPDLTGLAGAYMVMNFFSCLPLETTYSLAAAAPMFRT